MRDHVTDLAEREKELDCLYALSAEFARSDTSLDELLDNTVDILPRALRVPESGCALIRFEGKCHVSRRGQGGPEVGAEQPILVDGTPAGTLVLGYAGPPAGPEGPEVLDERERLLVTSVASLLGSVVQRRRAEDATRNYAARLEQSAQALEAKNSALREVLSQIEEEKRNLKAAVLANAENLVAPFLDRLREENLSARAQAALECARTALRDLTSSLATRVSDPQVRLSPREREICSLVKAGYSTKEMAELLHVSPLTIERHRHNIRRKLGIHGSDANLYTYLQTL